MFAAPILAFIAASIVCVGVLFVAIAAGIDIAPGAGAAFVVLAPLIAGLSFWFLVDEQPMTRRIGLTLAACSLAPLVAAHLTAFIYFVVLGRGM